MDIQKITMTGADNSTLIGKLVDLSQGYAPLEWGILFDKQLEDTPRYPGAAWVRELTEAAMKVAADKKNVPLQLSAHLCGQWVRDMVEQNRPKEKYLVEPRDGQAAYYEEREVEMDLVEGWFADRREFVDQFQRVQFNFHGEQFSVHDDFFRLLQQYPEKQFIFQMDGVNDAIYQAALDYGLTNVVPLFDKSSGAGRLFPWPHDAHEAWGSELVGYAGGLGPNNLAEQLPLIAEAAGDGKVWVDMESAIREGSGAVFSIPKVVAALDIISGFSRGDLEDEDDLIIEADKKAVDDATKQQAELAAQAEANLQQQEAERRETMEGGEANS